MGDDSSKPFFLVKVNTGDFEISLFALKIPLTFELFENFQSFFSSCLPSSINGSQEEDGFGCDPRF